ncbi:MAG TPA: hypothetical protein VKH19_03410 [Gemmatimonadaceae bacterium]|nr:hypothetical protein [Gemmatimonadaceae bacterium]
MSADADKRELLVLPGHWGSGRRQWTLVLAPPAIVFFQQQVSYALVSWSCSHARVLVHVPTIVALLLLGLVALASWRLLGDVGARSPGDERSSDARGRFMAACSLTLCAFALLLIIAQWLPAAVLHPCQR